MVSAGEDGRVFSFDSGPGVGFSGAGDLRSTTGSVFSTGGFSLRASKAREKGFSSPATSAPDSSTISETAEARTSEKNRSNDPPKPFLSARRISLVERTSVRDLRDGNPKVGTIPLRALVTRIPWRTPERCARTNGSPFAPIISGSRGLSRYRSLVPESKLPARGFTTGLKDLARYNALDVNEARVSGNGCDTSAGSAMRTGPT